MKLLFFTDLHARGDSPRARLDNYQGAMWRKLAEVNALAQQHGCQAVLFGGDLTHSPDAASSVVSDLIRALRQFGVPIIGVSGNTHDVWGDNPATLRRTALGVVEAAGLIHLLQPGEAYMLQDPAGFQVQITGQHYHAEIDRRDWRLDYCVSHRAPESPDECQHLRLPEATWAIHIVHGMLRTQPLPASVPWTCVEDVMNLTSADITLSGHDHLGYGVIRHGSRTACNPGALMRLTAAKEEIARPVQVALITLNADWYDVELIPLQSAAPGPEVLDRSRIDEAEDRANALDAFLAGVREGGHFEALDVPAIVQRIADNQGVTASVRQEALRRVQEAQEAFAEGAVVEEVG